MSIPSFVFLDTSVLDGQQYNFASTALVTFVPACATRSLKLLLPDPTEREIKRHIRERSTQAMDALEAARRKAPFLAKWRGLPQNLAARPREEFEVQRIAEREWEAFLKQFAVIRLGYDLLDVKTVMGWYDQAEAPFSEGKKRKEFPDAFAIAMLGAYAQREKGYIAVVSSDPDFKAACQRSSSLLYFASLPRLTEVLLSDDTRVEAMRLAIHEKIDIFSVAVAEELGVLSYYHTDERFETGDIDYDAVDIEDMSIVALGDGECTVAFESTVQISVDVRWEDGGDEEYGPRERNRTVKERVQLWGTAKVAFDHASGQVSSVTCVEFDFDEFPVTKSPFEIFR